ncbi:MAG: DUF805 domain-containing protein [Candidatus Magasanikbacteria bacterium]|jgi:uncharacterized membrane protein YhaH (DUF805 family)|nr:DUF805 domain-containing protein [Candidatus Magasanikbacteria bacterium]
MGHFLNAMKKYATFSGRARRAEYWYFELVFCVIYFALLFLGPSVHESFMILAGFFGLAMLLPALAVTARRLHDVDKSGWMMLIGFVPIIGQIWLLVLYVTPGTQGPNHYGPDPLAGPGAAPQM